ncbi:MAG: hypothetical protein ACRD4C_15150 [Candidatus Acidiferrales bacterium]
MRDAKSKLAWAKGHLQLLDIEITKFSNSQPYTLTREDDLEHGKHVLRFNMWDVPEPITLIAADAIYNMRSCLDQLVWSLACLTVTIPQKTSFPIVDGPVLTKNKLHSFNKSLLGVPPGAICEIDALQPYHSGAAFKAHPLWRLDEICNLDKHRRVPANGSAANIHFPGITENDVATGVVRIEAFDTGYVMSVPIAFKDKLNTHPTMQYAVVFGGDASGISERFGGLVEIYEFVAKSVLPRFESFFT